MSPRDAITLGIPTAPVLISNETKQVGLTPPQKHGWARERPRRRIDTRLRRPKLLNKAARGNLTRWPLTDETLPRRRFLHLAVGAAALPATSLIAEAQSYPTRPITMIVPFPAGGAADVISRIITERMRGLLGQSIVIENVGGADGSIGVGRAARARPDGYTVCLGIRDGAERRFLFPSV
jgi:hypothetical protein